MIAPWNSAVRLVADGPLHVEDDQRDHSWGSLAAMGTVSLIRTSTGSSNLDATIVQQQLSHVAGCSNAAASCAQCWRQHSYQGAKYQYAGLGTCSTSSCTMDTVLLGPQPDCKQR